MYSDSHKLFSLNVVFKVELHHLFLPWLYFASPGRSIGIDFDCIIHALLKWRYPLGTHGVHRISLCGLLHLAEGQRSETSDRSHTYTGQTQIFDTSLSSGFSSETYLIRIQWTCYLEVVFTQMHTKSMLTHTQCVYSNKPSSRIKWLCNIILGMETSVID